MRSDDWARTCGAIGRLCLVNISHPERFTMAWEQVAAMMVNVLANESTFLRLRPLHDTSADHAQAARAEKVARTDPMRFVRRWAADTGMPELGPGPPGRAPDRANNHPFEWYISWQDDDPDESVERLFATTLDDRRLGFLPANWRRRPGGWFFVGSSSNAHGMAALDWHVDEHIGVQGTFHIQLHGRKRWRFAAPDACKSVCGADEFELIVSPGQVLSLDTTRWQHATHTMPEDEHGQLPFALGIARDFYLPTAAPGRLFGWPFVEVDADRDGTLTLAELIKRAHAEIDFEQTASREAASSELRAWLLARARGDDDYAVTEEEYAALAKEVEAAASYEDVRKEEL